MAKKADASVILSATAQATKQIIEQTATETEKSKVKRAPKRTNKETQAPTNREKAGRGRPTGDRQAKLNLSLTDEHKDFLRLRCYELSTSRHVVTAADIIEGLLDAEMKRYYKQKAREEAKK